MDKIVVVYGIGDECSWSAEEVVPLEYKSVEAFIVDFTAWANALCKKATENDTYPIGVFNVGSHEFSIEDFRYEKSKPLYDKSNRRDWAVSLPEIYTLAEWFEQNKA